MRKLIIGFFILWITFFLSGELKYKISGKVTREGAGVKGYKLQITHDTEKGSKGKAGKKEFITGEDGSYYFNLIPGKYNLLCYSLTSENGEDELIPMGPHIIHVVEKDIENLDFTLLKELEILDAYKNILEEIPEDVLSVTYKWGRVPLFNEAECKIVAEKQLEELKKENGADILKGSSLGIPVKIYDMSENPVFYQFSIINLNVEVGYIGIHAIGIKPKEAGVFSYMDITLSELKDSKELYEGRNETLDANISKAIKAISKAKGIDKNDIEFGKLLCLGPDSFSFGIMLKILSKNEDIIVMEDFSALTDDETIEEIKNNSEARYTLAYIFDRLAEKELEPKKEEIE
ncbi:MAG: hypothetical protein ABFR75_13075 [Acidobacteriota bacterium]